MSKIITKAGRELAYFLGNGDLKKPPIVFVHGFPLDHRTWQRVNPTGRTEIMVDLPGFGGSKLPQGKGSMAAYAAALIDLLDELNIEKAVFCGHSMGGYVCLETLASFPRRVAGLALVGSQPLADSPEKRIDRQQMIERLSAQGIQAVAGMASVLGCNSAGKDLFEEIILSQDPKAAIFAVQAMISRKDHARTLLDANIPRLIAHGEQDGVVPFTAYSNVLRDHGIRVEMFADVGHSPMIEASVEFSANLQDWLMT